MFLILTACCKKEEIEDEIQDSHPNRSNFKPASTSEHLATLEHVPALVEDPVKLTNQNSQDRTFAADITTIRKELSPDYKRKRKKKRKNPKIRKFLKLFK